MTTGARIPWLLGYVRLGAAPSGTITSTQTQAGVSAIQQTTSQTLSGSALILSQTTQIQTGVSSILSSTTRTQSGVSHIVGSGPTVKRTICPYRLGFSVLGCVTPSTGTFTQTQSGISTIVDTNVRTQIGVSAILGLTTRTQTGISNIHAAQSQKLQIGNSLIHPATSQRVQYGISNIHAGQSQQNQSGVSHIIGLGTVQKLLTGISNIQATTVPPTAPGSPSVSQVGSANVLTWTAATSAVGIGAYLIYRCSGVGCTFFTLIATVSGSTLTYTDSTIGPGPYTYKIVAQNNAGINGPASAPVSIDSSATTIQTQTGVSKIGSGTIRNQTGISSIVSATPSEGLRVTQLVNIVARHPEPGPEGNRINISQVVGIGVRYPTAIDIHVSQVVLIVVKPYLGRICYGYTGDNLGIGTPT